MSNQTMTMTTTENKITKKDLRNSAWRFMIGSQLNWNYERMMGSGYLFGMMPILEKLYGHDPEQMQQMCRVHNQFFNTNANFGPLIMGIDAAIEEAEGVESQETVATLKTSLMGSLAGVGDSIFHVIWGTLFGSIAGAMALQGSYLGIIFWLIFNIFKLWVSTLLMPLGYKQGTKLVTTLKDKLTAFTNAATVLGVTVIGALIPTAVSAKVPFVYEKKVNGEAINSLVIQDVLDGLMPGLIPVLLVWLAYWLLGRKNLNSTRVIWILVAMSVVLYTLKVLA